MSLHPSTLRVDVPELCQFSVRIPQGMTRKELGVRKFTAQFSARYGMDFWDALWDRVCSEAEFQFLKRNEIGFGNPTVLTRLSVGYMHVIKPFIDRPRKRDTARMEAVVEGFFAALDAFKKKQQEDEEDEVMDEVLTDRRDFVVSDEYFVEIEKKELPPREKLGPLMLQCSVRPDRCLDPDTFRVGIPGGGMMRKELGIIKLTAQFVARYGSKFQDDLWKRMCTETEFQFLNRNPGNDRYTLFSRFLVAYGTIIRPWAWAAPPEAAVEGFLAALDAFKKKQGGKGVVVEKLVTDRGDFVLSDEYFLDIEFSPLPETRPQKFFPRVHMERDSATLPHLPYISTAPWYASWPKRHRESALVSEEEFLAQHPGSATIRVMAGMIRACFVVRITSLSETVGSLKEKIAKQTGMPVNGHNLFGKTGVLKDDMSLAHYNLGLGEILHLLW